MGSKPQARIKIIENGPYRVSGAGLVRMRPIADEDGQRVEWHRGVELEHDAVFELCRCGESKNKPFCDGTEKDIGFKGSETADRGPTALRRQTYGDGQVVLTDDRSLCSKAKFCVARDIDAWQLAKASGDPKQATRLKEMVRRCPSGRLVYYVLPDETAVEQELPMEVGVIENGPLWSRGGIPIESSDGFQYEIRNRATLCRCGHSSNKPFCDGSHVSVGFHDP